MINQLLSEHRLVLDAELTPVVGSTFQPTGFPNLGAAEFERPGQPPSLIVESVQSMANHLEATLWSEPDRQPVEAVANLPWVRVKAPDGGYLTSSREEPHRLASPYVRKAQIGEQTGADWLIEKLAVKNGRPQDRAAIHGALFDIDPLCLVHGLFLSDPAFKDFGNPKVRRALHAVIEAHDVRPAISGGVKRDDVRFTADSKAGAGSEDGYGFVPFSRTEYVAERIVLSAALDLEQLRNYRLGAQRTRLLGLVALYEVVTLLSRPLRLRTACDLEVVSVTVRGAEPRTLPTFEGLESELATTAAAVGFVAPTIIEAVHQDKG
ncbi:MAG: type I-U CRISPR-associated RAMP protein Csb1/Cas7u [Solirubrobacteraceae bacterium]